MEENLNVTPVEEAVETAQVEEVTAENTAEASEQAAPERREKKLIKRIPRRKVCVFCPKKIRFRGRKNSPPPYDRHLRKAPESACHRHQTRETRRPSSLQGRVRLYLT